MGGTDSYSVENRFVSRDDSASQIWVVIASSRGPDDPTAACTSPRDAMVIARALNFGRDYLGKRRENNGFSAAQATARAGEIVTALDVTSSENALDRLIEILMHPPTFANWGEMSTEIDRRAE